MSINNHLSKLIYVIIFLASFSTFCLNPLKTEYVYVEVAESHNSTRKALNSCDKSNTSEVDILIAREVSRLTLLLDLTMFMPASVAVIFVNSWSDRVGRRMAMVIPLIGMTSSSAFLAVIIKMRLSLSWMYLYNVIAGLGGYYMALLMQGNAYLSDITPPEKRGFRFAIMETTLGVGGGIAGLVGGYWVNSQGYFQPVLCTVGMGVVCLCLLVLLPESKTKVKRKEEMCESNTYDSDYESISRGTKRSLYGSIKSENSLLKENEHKKVSHDSDQQEKYSFVDLMKSVWKVHSSEYSHCAKCFNSDIRQRLSIEDRCQHGGGYYPGRVRKLWLYLLLYNIYMFIVVGGMAFTILYVMASPLCFSTLLIGVMMGMKFTLITFVPLTVIFYQKILKLSNNSIILLGFIGQALGCIAMSLAYQKFVIFIGTSTFLISSSAKPFIKAQISSLVSSGEQGSAFALLSGTEVLSYMVATASFLSLYPATVGIFHGFTWAFAACIVVLPIALITTIMMKDRKSVHQVATEREPIIH